MKYSFLLSVFILIACWGDLSAKKEATIQVKEIYYDVSSEGEINKNIVVETRELIYDKSLKFISGKAFKNNKTIVLTSDANEYYSLPLYQRDNDNCSYDNGLVVKYKEIPDDSTSTDHILKYDDHGNLLEDSFCDSKQKIILTYDYLYLDNFTYAERNGEKFISGMKPNTNQPWIMRTIKQNGIIVQYTERKIKGKS